MGSKSLWFGFAEDVNIGFDRIVRVQGKGVGVDFRMGAKISAFILALRTQILLTIFLLF